MDKLLRVGIIGASAERGWAKESHVPAVQNIAGLELAAVATGSQPSADAAAKAFGVKTGYGNAEDLIRDPEIDIVTVAVKVPDHKNLVSSALSAGKHVYCEWPLGRDVAESEELAAAARASGVYAVIGLQSRPGPVAHRAREMIAAGAIGRVLSAQIYSGTIAFGRKMGTADAYLDDASNGATLVAIHGGHALDLACAIVGGFEDVAALLTTQYPEIEVGDEGKRQARTIPDHMLVQARLTSGGALSVEVAGGRPANDTPFYLNVTGESGTLSVEGGAPRGFQSGRLRLSFNGEPQHINPGKTALTIPDAAANVYEEYIALRDDILQGTSTAPDFEHAVRLSRLIGDVMSSSETGVRKQASGWPKQ